jgi:hypothetical protein
MRWNTKTRKERNRTIGGKEQFQTEEEEKAEKIEYMWRRRKEGGGDELERERRGWK